MRVKFAEATDTPAYSKAHPLDHESYDQAPIKISLVLTGGGSHGAFEAGVLEAIADQFEFESISGTSAGTFNAILFGSGLNASGASEGIRRMREGWGIVKSHGNIFGRSMRLFSDGFLPKNQRWPNMSPLSFNPIQIFKNISQYTKSIPARFISTTVSDIVKDWKSEVQNGRVKIYANTALENRDNPHELEHIILSGKDLTPDGVGASANLKEFGTHYIEDVENPELKGRRAFDGAYKENGPLAPHIENNVTDCIMIVLHDRRHNKLDDGELKHAEIHSNVLNMVASDSHYSMRFHAIEIESLGGEIGGLDHMDDSSKLNTDPEFINLLYQAGLRAGREWLKNNAHYIGQRSSYPLFQPALEQMASARYA